QEDAETADRLRVDERARPRAARPDALVDALAGSRVEDGDALRAERRDRCVDVRGAERETEGPLGALAERLAQLLREPSRRLGRCREELEIRVAEPEEDVRGPPFRMPAAPRRRASEESGPVRFRTVELGDGEDQVVETEARRARGRARPSR